MIIAGTFVLCAIFAACSGGDEEADTSPLVLAQKAQFLDALHAEEMPLERFAKLDVIYHRNGISIFVQIPKDAFESMTQSEASQLNVTEWAKLVSTGLVLFELHFAQTHNIPVKNSHFACFVELHDHGVTGQETVWRIGNSDYMPWKDSIEWANNIY